MTIASPTPNENLKHCSGCSCSLKGCGFTLLILYLLQMAVAVVTIWHSHQERSIGDIRLTLSYTIDDEVLMFIPGVGAFPLIVHWSNGGKGNLLLTKELTYYLPDGRQYKCYDEDYPRLEKLGIVETPEGIQLLDADGRRFVDSPPIPRAAFIER